MNHLSLRPNFSSLLGGSGFSTTLSSLTSSGFEAISTSELSVVASTSTVFADFPSSASGLSLPTPPSFANNAVSSLAKGGMERGHHDELIHYKTHQNSLILDLTMAICISLHFNVPKKTTTLKQCLGSKLIGL